MAFKVPNVIAPNTKKKTVELALGGKSITTGMTIFFKEFKDTIEKVAKVSRDMKPIWRVVQKEVMAGIDEIFEKEGSLQEGDWPKLKERYAKKKKEAVGDRGILVYSGVMQASIQVERMTSNSLKITAKDPKAPLHHFGGKIPGGKGTMPRRPFMYMTDDTQKRIIEALSTTYTMAMNNKNNPRPKEVWSQTARKIKGR